MSHDLRHDLHHDLQYGFDAARLEAFLREALPEVRGAMRLAPVGGGGQSNPTFFVSFDNRRLVLRKKPGGAVLPSAHAVDREHRVMSALRASRVPVAPTVLFHAAPDVVGTPFYLMERLDGRIFPDHALPELRCEERAPIYRAMAETLAVLHAVDPGAVGLADYGRAGSFFERQIARWSRQWALSQTRAMPALDALLDWLPKHVPPQRRTTLVHGDFKLGNLMFHPSEPRVIAVLDWELSTLGDPLSDVAFNGVAWRTLRSEYGGLRDLDLPALGIPSEAEQLASYRAAGGSADGLAPFHFAFSFMRWAVIFAGIAARAQQGNAVADNAAEVGALAEAMARRGLEAIEITRH